MAKKDRRFTERCRQNTMSAGTKPLPDRAEIPVITAALSED
ncbi:hypothetical protein [Oscillibacter sp. 1-3]|nr:hypothetical protein [Oscillibacter sp. 1-3]EOS65926.1 hypothetical protein C816_01780 [Oscillibacter sp. 1-3]